MTDRSRRGVSPLIGAVILVSLVMVAAGIMTGFLTDFTERQTGEIENRSQEDIQCSYAAIFIEQVVFDDPNDEVRVDVSNSGTVDLSNVTIHVLRNSRLTNSTFVTNIEAGGSPRTGTITYKNSQTPDMARAQSLQCPAVVDEETSIETR